MSRDNTSLYTKLRDIGDSLHLPDALRQDDPDRRRALIKAAADTAGQMASDVVCDQVTRWLVHESGWGALGTITLQIFVQFVSALNDESARLLQKNLLMPYVLQGRGDLRDIVVRPAFAARGARVAA